MRIIIDSNVLFSALIKDSTTRKIILGYDGFFLFPSLIFEELEKHKADLLKKSSMDAGDFVALLELILTKVVIVPSEFLYQHRTEAQEIVKDIDLDDLLFIACGLAYPGSIIWSDDKSLKKQPKIKVLSTNEIMKLLI